MTPDTVDWDNVKKTDAYGIPIVFMLFGIGLLLIYTKHHLKFGKNQADNLGYM